MAKFKRSELNDALGKIDFRKRLHFSEMISAAERAGDIEEDTHDTAYLVQAEADIVYRERGLSDFFN